MRVWMPYVEGGSGTDVFSRYLSKGLQNAGLEVILQRFNRYYQFAPQLLKWVPAPSGTNIVLTNTWSGFAFKRSGTRMVAVEHLFLFDPALNSYKSFAQQFYHETLIRRYVTRSIKEADAVVAVSQYVADMLVSELQVSIPRVILNAVDTDFFTPAPEYKEPLDGRRVRLLFVGNLTRRKGADLLKPIMDRLGDGFELHFTQGLRQNRFGLKASASLKPMGQLNYKEVREAYRQADLFLFPSRAEGLPLAVLESMACGTPIVAANVSSLPEVLSEGGGLLCQVDNIDDFVQSIQRLTDSAVNIATMSHQARFIAERRFSMTRMIDEYLALFGV